MKEDLKKELEDAGFMHIHEYVDDCICGAADPAEKISALQLYQQASEKFHLPGGDGFSCVINCLQKYLDYKFIQRNNHFRFGEELFDAAVEIYRRPARDDASQYRYIANRKKPHKSKEKKTILEGTRADLYFLLDVADQNCIAANRCIEYVTSSRLHLSAVLIQMIERIVDAMEQDEIKKRRVCGEIIRKTYMDKNFADWEIMSIYEYLDMTKRTYYRLRNHGITLISQTLFGVFAGEQGIAEVYIKGDEIILPELYKKNKNGT